MADPTIQTFCCHSTNSSDTTFMIITEFSPDTYNAVCLFSATMGILGAIYQILPRKQYSRNHRWISLSAERGRRIIFWLAVSDLLASFGVLIRASIWLNYKNIMPALDDGCSMVFCSLTSAWIQYFYTATWIWTLCYAIDMRLVLREREERIPLYHFSAWVVPAILTLFGLFLLYFPDARCHTTNSTSDTLLRILPNYMVTYIPILVVMITNPILYLWSCKDMQKIVTCSSGQFTRRERDIIEAVKIKFSAINIVFYICWFPNLINGVLLWTMWFELPVTMVISTWYMMAFMNPLQALFNCLVYRRWNGDSEIIVFPWSGKEKSIEESKSKENSNRMPSRAEEERLPLLQQFKKVSINRYGEC